MLPQTQNFEFGEFLLDSREKVLLRDGNPLSITPKAFELLLVLVKNHGHLVEKDELMNSVWADSFVEEGNLTFTIGLLRKVLGDDTKSPYFIETVPKRGYRFIGKIVERSNDAASEIEPTAAVDFPVTTQLEVPAGPDERYPSSEPSIHQEPTRYVLFALGFATAISLILLLSFNFWPGSSSEKAKARSIAILPVRPLTVENRDFIYEFGIADSLNLKLSAANNLIVRPLSSTRKYADITQDAVAAGRELEVDYVLAWNYQIADGKIRVTAQLFNIATGQIEETYKNEKETGNIFSTQDAIAGEVGNLLLVRLSNSSSNPAAKRGTDNEEAYRLYLLGKNLMMQRNGDNQKAIDYLEQSVRLDPNFARGYSSLAFAYKQPEKAEAAIEKALELDNNLSEAYAVRGSINLFAIWVDFPQAEKDILRAIELDPNNDFAHWLFSLLRFPQGRFDEAIREIEIASAISPTTVVYIRDRARILYYARRYDEAIVQYKRVLETDDDYVAAQNQLWMSYELNGDYALAYEIFIKQREKWKDENLEDFKRAYASAGWQGVMQKQRELCRLTETAPETNFYSAARQCAYLGEKERAFAYLNRSFEKGQYQMVFINVEPRFDSLRNDPRFRELSRRVGLE